MFPTDLRHFSRSEFNYPNKILHSTLYFLDELRERVGCPIRVTSDGRPWDEGSPHSRFTAVDFFPIPFNFENRMETIRVAKELYDDGMVPRLGFEAADGHFHVDQDPVLRRPYFWVGESK